MATAKKQAAIAEIEERMKNASALLLTEYRGLSVSQITELRAQLRGSAEYSVAKNTLARVAARNLGMDYLVDELTGPTAITFVSGEAVDAAKALRDFAADHEQLVIKGGTLEGRYLTADEVKALANLDNRETTLAKLAGAMKAKLVQAVRTFDALREKQETAA